MSEYIKLQMRHWYVVLTAVDSKLSKFCRSSANLETLYSFLVVLPWKKFQWIYFELLYTEITKSELKVDPELQ